VAIDWALLGTGIAGVVSGIGGWVMGRGKRNVETAATGAETAVITLLRQEVERLSARLTALEQREGRMVRHIYRLEGLMRAKDIEPPPFDLDSDTIRAGGTD
jgi:hypothetical protein